MPTTQVERRKVKRYMSGEFFTSGGDLAPRLHSERPLDDFNGKRFSSISVIGPRGHYPMEAS